MIGSKERGIKIEIKRLMDKYRSHSPKEFFDWLAKDKVVELRFLNDYLGNKFYSWDLIKFLAKKHSIESRFNSLFINSYDQMKDILLYRIKNMPLTKLFNIFIGVNPRRKITLKSKSGITYKSYQGSIAGTSHIQNILCDIEHKNRNGNATEAELEECIQAARFLVKSLELESYWINVSGNGGHLWFDLDEPIELEIPRFQEYDDKIKYFMKEEPIVTYIKTYNRFIEKLDRLLQKHNPKLKVDDGAKDIARIARAPGSWNVKAGKTQRCVGTVEKKVSNNKYNFQKFMAAKPVISNKLRKQIKIHEISKDHRYNYLNIQDSPLYQLLISKMLPSTLSRNHYLEQSFARLIRDNNIDQNNISDVIAEIDGVQNKSIQVDPEYLDDDGPFNPEMVNTYCFECQIPFVYEVLGEIPKIPIIYRVNPIWDKISIETMKRIVINLERPPDYIKLKSLVRTMIDNDIDRQTLFLGLKYIYLNNWEYYKPIIIEILDKTRRRNINK